MCFDTHEKRGPVTHDLRFGGSEQPEIGQTAVTVRRGDKWYIALDEGDKLNLMFNVNGPNEPAAKVGEAEVVEVIGGDFQNIPARIVELEHATAARTYNGLLSAMRAAYGEDFNENEFTTALIYRRTA